jgi:hypothetical protein
MSKWSRTCEPCKAESYRVYQKAYQDRLKAAIKAKRRAIKAKVVPTPQPSISEVVGALRGKTACIRHVDLPVYKAGLCEKCWGVKG